MNNTNDGVSNVQHGNSKHNELCSKNVGSKPTQTNTNKGVLACGEVNCIVNNPLWHRTLQLYNIDVVM